MERIRLQFINDNIHKLFNLDSLFTFTPNINLDFESTCVLNEITSFIGVWNLRSSIRQNQDEYRSLFIEYIELETLKHIINTKCLEYYKGKLQSQSFYTIDGNFDIFKDSFYTYLNNYVEFNIRSFKNC